MKTIGIILREFDASYKNVKLYGIRKDIVNFLRKYEVNVIAIPVIFNNDDSEFEKVKNVINMCDGIIFPGGMGIRSIDHKITKYCYDIDKPTLGLCLGAQIIGETFNGCVKCLNNQNHNSEDEYVHKVKIDKNSVLYKILQKDEISVNSRHNNYVYKTSLLCSAISEDEIIEAVEDSSKKFFMGFQWHPESLVNDEKRKKIFNYFIKKLN